MVLFPILMYLIAVICFLLAVIPGVTWATLTLIALGLLACALAWLVSALVAAPFWPGRRTTTTTS